jgi:7-cyano-7-deazaguanine synthase
VTTIVMLSGGLDSAVALYLAIAVHGRKNVRALSFDYGQRHAIELERAARIAASARVTHEQITIDLAWARTALITGGEAPPDSHAAVVPARNTVLVSHAAARAAAERAGEIWIGCGAADAEAFADCRPEWINAMSVVLDLGVAPGLRLIAPHIDRSKAQIIRRARELGPDCWHAVGCSWSCYSPADGRPCGACGACRARAAGFADAVCVDPAIGAP